MRRFEASSVAFDRHGALPLVGSTASIAAFMATKGGGRSGLAPEAQRRAETKWRMAEGRLFCLAL
jgi:hypothetical protein